MIPAGWELGHWPSLETLSFETWPGETEADKADRLLDISNRMLNFVLAGSVKNVFVENYAFSRSSSSVTKLAELGGAIRVLFRMRDLVLRPVVASSARKLLLGKLPRKNAKVAVQQALYAHGALFHNDDECDAYVVANFGMSELGLTAMSLA
jgi:Holliday junction resolvasome RuvABC endonuclease subunit